MVNTANVEKILDSTELNSEKTLTKVDSILGENIKKLLKSNKISINELANHLKLPIMTIRRIMTGETSDPRISTVKLFADYFNVSIDSLLFDLNILESKINSQSHTIYLPHIDWETLKKISSTDNLDLKNWQQWQPITLKENEFISAKAFALDSRPFVYERFPKGSVFIVDPLAQPSDGDLILVKINNDDITIKELFIDPPEWHLNGVINHLNKIVFNQTDHKIIGVILLTLLYSRK